MRSDWYLRIRFLGLFSALFLALLVGGCRRGETPTPTATAVLSATATPVVVQDAPEASPQASAPASTPVEAPPTAYDGPASPTPRNPYPGDAGEPVAQDPYPAAPGGDPGQGEATPVAAQQPTAYVGPPSPTPRNPYPMGTHTPTPFGAPTATRTATQPPATPVPGATTGAPMTATGVAVTPTSVGAPPTGVAVTPTAQPAATASPLPTLTRTPTPSPTPTPTITPFPTVSFALFTPTDPTTVELANGEVQLIGFFAFWGLDSRAMAPTMNRLETEYGDRMKFVFLDIDNPASADLRRALGFRFQPHYFLVDGRGKVIHQWLGQTPYDRFATILDGVLPNPTPTPSRTPRPN